MSARARILLVEDNPADVFMLREALNRSGLDYDLELIAERVTAFVDRVAAKR